MSTDPQTDLLTALGASPVPARPDTPPTDHGPAERLFGAPVTTPGQLAMATDE